MRLNLKAINAELARLGYQATLAKGDGYFYFQGGDAAAWLDPIVRVPTLRSLTLEQWTGQYKELQAKHKALAKGKITGRGR
jgi:hypothetical protein